MTRWQGMARCRDAAPVTTISVSSRRRASRLLSPPDCARDRTLERNSKCPGDERMKRVNAQTAMDGEKTVAPKKVIQFFFFQIAVRPSKVAVRLIVLPRFIVFFLFFILFLMDCPRGHHWPTLSRDATETERETAATGFLRSVVRLTFHIRDAFCL